MKIGILTHHYVSNYGAFLQTYSLQKYLQKQFPTDEVKVINYINRKHSLINKLGWLRLNPKNESIKEYFKKIKVPFVFKKIEKEYLKTTKKVYTAEQVNKLNFDIIIIGSDEVWHYQDKKAYDPIKFGYGLKCKNIIAYAPSMGSSELSNIPQEILEGIKNIKSFSARDNKAETFVNQILKKECTRVLDPTLLINLEEYNSNTIEKIKKEKYILMYYCDNITKKVKNEIIAYAKNNNCKIYGAGESKKWFDKSFIDINPFEWAEMFKYAECIFTGTFHGTVFSIKNKKNFYNYLTNKSRINKVKSLLQELKIEDRNIANKAKMEKKTNYTEYDKIINQRVKESEDYINKSISKSCKGEK